MVRGAKNSFFAILDRNPKEVAVFKQRLLQGKIDGTTYNNGRANCGCLLGTLAEAKFPLESRPAFNCNMYDELRGSMDISPFEDFLGALNCSIFDNDSTCEQPSDKHKYCTNSLGPPVLPGSTPSNNKRAKQILKWLEEWESAKPHD